MKTLTLAPTLALVVCLGLCGACASAPETDRPAVPDRPEVNRPEGLEPEGLADIRSSIGAQRTAARERSNALMMTPNELSTTSTTPWYETALWPVVQVADLIRGF